jgi:hypothetical protein
MQNWLARVRRASCLVAVLLLAAPSAAQNTTGEISGYVKDSTGAVLPGVTVTLAYPAIAFERTTVSDSAGYYVFPGIPNGRADLTAELAGFQTITQKDMAVELNARLRIDLTMSLSQLAETVEVTAEAAPAISTRADVSHLISGEQTKEIPIDGRSYMQLMSIVPGVSRNEGSYEFGTSFRADAQQVNGLRKNFSALTLDGAENLDAGSNATQVNNVSIDAIEEFRVMNNTYGAEFGKAAGAQVNVVTKSGTRTFRGGASYFFRDDQFDADNFRTGEKDVLDFKNFGWNFSGPIGWPGFNQDRSKLFFFVLQEWKQLESQVGLTRINTTPSLLERQGNFSQSPRIPTDPRTGQPFPGGIIPVDRLSPNGLELVSRFPVPDADSRNRVTISPTQDRDIREDIIKLDYRPTPAATVTMRLIRDTVEQLEPYGSFGGTSGYAQVPTSHDRFSDSAMLSVNHTVGSRIFHELSLSAIKNNQDLFQTGDLYTRDGLAIPETYPGNRLDRAPNITSMTGYSMGTGLFGTNYPTHIIGNYYVLRDNWTMSRSQHTFKAGLYAGQFRKSEEVRTPDAGSFTFADNTTGGTGVALANALIGLYDRYTEADRAPFGNIRYWQFEVYAQDHWQVRPNLTLDYGLRYQYMPAMFERDDLLATFDPARYDPALAPLMTPTGNLVPGTGLLENGIPVVGIAKAGVDGVPRGLYGDDGDNFGPRVGFTWDPWSNGNTAFRGGFGISFDRPVTNSSRDQAASPPLVRTVDLARGSVDNPGGGIVGTAPPGGFEAVSMDFESPVVYTWSLGVQRTLPWKMALDVNYVSNEAHNLLRVRELNFVQPGATGVAPTPINNNRPYTGYSRIIMNETTGSSDYRGLQVALNRRTSDDLSFGVAYTLSRSRGDSDSEDSTSSGSLAQDPRDVDAEWSWQDFDRRHVLAVNYIYRLPFFRDDTSVLGFVLGGWQVNGITRYQSGRRLNITAGTNSALFGDTVTVRANGVEGVDPNSEPEGGRTEARWLNTAAFVRPPANTLGTLERNAVEGPSAFTTDLSVSKNFRVSRVRLQLRAEAFNVFNQKNYRSIETSVTNANFGAVTEYEAQRIMQFGVKVTF